MRSLLDLIFRPVLVDGTLDITNHILYNLGPPGLGCRLSHGPLSRGPYRARNIRVSHCIINLQVVDVVLSGKSRNAIWNDFIVIRDRVRSWHISRKENTRLRFSFVALPVWRKLAIGDAKLYSVISLDIAPFYPFSDSRDETLVP